MIDVAAWGGAQWVLVTLLAMGMITPFGFSDAVGQKFWIQWSAKLISHSFLVAILAWGGFWA